MFEKRIFTSASLIISVLTGSGRNHVKTVAPEWGSYLMWRSLRGLFKPLSITDEATQMIVGRLGRVLFRGSFPVSGPLGRELLLGASRLADRFPEYCLLR